MNYLNKSIKALYNVYVFSQMEDLKQTRKSAYRYPATTLKAGNRHGRYELPYWL